MNPQSAESPLPKALKDRGHSVTQPRQVVFQALQGSGPVSIKQLHQRLHGQIDRSSLYRTLHLFRQLGFINDVTVGFRQLIEISERFDHHHHHFTCRQCHNTISIADPALEHRLDAWARAKGFQLESHQIELAGICATCAALG